MKEDEIPAEEPEAGIDESAAQEDGSASETDGVNSDAAQTAGADDNINFDTEEDETGSDPEEINENDDIDDFSVEGIELVFEPQPEKTDEEAEAEDTDEKETGKKRPAAKAFKYAAVGVGIIVGLAAALYLGGAAYYDRHFLPNTNIGNFDCSNLSAKKASEQIKTDINDYAFKLIEKNDESEIISGKEISLAYQAIGSVDALLETQKPFEWFLHTQGTDLPIDIEVTFDENALRSKIESLGCVAKSNAGMDGATAGVYYDGEKFTVKDDGTHDIVSVNMLVDKAKAGIYNLYPQMSLIDEGCYVGLAGEDRMSAALAEMNKYVSTKVTYRRGDESSFLDGGTINLWLSMNEDYTINLNISGVSEYVEELAALYNTIGSARNFVTSNGSSITVYGGDYGWRVNQSAEIDELCAIIRSGEEVTREPVYRQTAGSHGPNNDLSNTYVEISIGGQHLWYYKDGVLVVSTDVVTGNPNAGNSTPTGIYRIKYKERNATLVGEDYKTPVSYWMPFNGGIGLHDASWRGAFGGAIYCGGGSHGCVNMPPGAAAAVYQSIQTNDAVVIY